MESRIETALAEMKSQKQNLLSDEDFVLFWGFLLSRFVKKRANREAWPFQSWCVVALSCRSEMIWMSIPSIMFELYTIVEVILFYLYCWIVSFGWNPIHPVMTEKISGCCTPQESHMDHVLQKDVQLRSISPGEPWSGSRTVSHSDRNDQHLAGWVLKQKEI